MQKDDFDGQCQSQREGKNDKDKKINERVLFCVFHPEKSSLLFGDCHSGGGGITGAPPREEGYKGKMLVAC